MSFLFLIILLLFIIERNDGCMQTPVSPHVIVITKTTTTQPTTTTTQITTTTPTTTSTSTTTTTTTTTTTAIPTTSTTSTTTTTTSTTTTISPIPCVAPAGSASVVIDITNYHTIAQGLTAASIAGISIPISGTCTCGSAFTTFFAAQKPPFPTGAPPVLALNLCFNVAFPFPCFCSHQCVCTFGGNCYVIGTNPGLGTNASFTNDVQYYPFADGTLYAFINTGNTYDDQTGLQVTLPFGFQVAAIGCGGCGALRATMALNCTATGPLTVASAISIDAIATG